MIAGAALLFSVAAVSAQRGEVFLGSRNHPSIGYDTGPFKDAVSELNRKLQDGTVRFTFDNVSGYLRSTLGALNVASESQVVTFAPTSLQRSRITPGNPRALFYNDAVAVGWVRDAPFLEVASQDPQRGAIFYTLDQKPAETPQFKRNNGCLGCHLTSETLKVPGPVALSTPLLPEDLSAVVVSFVSDHRKPLGDRWGGWYVTGRHVPARHMGNAVNRMESAEYRRTDKAPALESLKARFDTTGYLSPYSDIVALLVLEHQTHMTNLLTRIGWEARLAEYERLTPYTAPSLVPGDSIDFAARIHNTTLELVDYLLFIDEAALGGGIQGSSGFAEWFSAQGPRDSKGRSLREFDLERRLMRYPCSYLIYTEAFDALPPVAKEAIYKRMWEILSGQEKSEQYHRLSLADRAAIIEILRDTKKDLPDYFRPMTN